MKPLDDLARWLNTYHPYYTINDVRPSEVPGYLRTTKPCRCAYPPFDGGTLGFPSGLEQAHYHTLYIGGYRKGYGRGMYAFWRAVVKYLGDVEHVLEEAGYEVKEDGGKSA